MKTLQFISVLVLLSIAFSAFGQENAAATPQRTPEQEALKQTDKLQQELNLTPEQAKQIYDINLRYARERQISNKRSEALERMKNKNADIQQVLNQEQNEKLQTKRYERTNTESPAPIQNRPINPTGFRSGSDFRSNPAVRVTSGDAPVRSSFRSSTPSGTQNSSTQPQTIRRSVTTTESAPGLNSAVRPTSGDAPFRSSTPSGTQNSSNQPQTIRRSVTTEPAPRTNPASVRQSVSTPAFVPRRTETPSTPSRK